MSKISAMAMVCLLAMSWACGDESDGAGGMLLVPQDRDMRMPSRPDASNGQGEMGGGEMDMGPAVREDMARADMAQAVDMAPGRDMLGPEPDLGPLPEPVRRSWVVGKSEQGRPIMGELYGSSGPVLFLLSAIHGNERIAVSFGEQVRTTLLSGLAEEAGIQVVFVPHANPDGVNAGTRQNSNGVDLNRNFHTDNFDPDGTGGMMALSESETQALATIVEGVMPTAVVSVHCCAPLFDYDGPGQPLADEMAKAVNEAFAKAGESARFRAKTPMGGGLGPYSGSMGSYVGLELKIPIITVEFARSNQVDTAPQLQAMHQGIRAAARWVSTQGMAPVEPLEQVLGEMERGITMGVDYRSQSWPTTFGTSHMHLEQVGEQTPERPVLLVAGARENALGSLYMAEHLRLALLARQSQGESLPPMVIYTAANPEGINAGSTLVAGGEFEATVAEGGGGREGQVFRRVIEEMGPRLVVFVEQDGQGPSLQMSLPDWALFDPARVPMMGFRIKEEGLEGPLATWLADQGIALMRVGVDGMYMEGQNDTSSKVPQVFSRALSSLLGSL